MRTNNIEVELIIPYPIDKPDRNGTLYSKEAVEKAVSKMKKGLPIIFRSNDDEGDGVVVGMTIGDAKIIESMKEDDVCKVSVKGIIYYGGSECVANINNGSIDDFTVMSIGISTA